MGVPVPKQKALLKLFSIFGHFPPNKFGVISLKDKTTPKCGILLVECIGFEPTTPALSRRCSKPTELTLQKKSMADS